MKTKTEFQGKMQKLLERAKAAVQTGVNRTEDIVVNRNVMPGTRLRSGELPKGALNQAAKKLMSIEFDMKALSADAK